MIHQIASAWAAAVMSEYARPEMWQRWADAKILAIPAPEMWLINMCVARDCRAVLEAISELQQLEQTQPPEFNEGDIRLGYSWLRYQRGELSLAEYLRTAGLLAEFLGTVGYGIFYENLARLEAGATPAEVEANIAVRLAHIGDMAQQHWTDIQDWMPSP